jgi:hypothetical protein
VYLVTWFVLHVTGEKDAQIGPGDEGKFQVNYIVSLIGMKCEAVAVIPYNSSSCTSTAYSVDWHWYRCSDVSGVSLAGE